MIVKKLNEAPFSDLKGYENITKQIVLGPDDGSNEIVLRYFSVEPGGSSPHHSHDFPHLVKIEGGKGVLVDEGGHESPLEAGDYIYIHDNEVHNFRNVGQDTFKFICIVPKRGEA